MKTITPLLGILGLLCLLAGCADINGLHNQAASKVTFAFKSVPAANGTWSVAGNFQTPAWDNSTTLVSLSGGQGTSEPVYVTRSTLEFSLVPKDSWDRPWYPAMKGNAWDPNSGGKQWNFSLIGIPLGNEITITIDGSTTPATVTVQQ